jgi:putative ABC transport system permease protein
MEALRNMTDYVRALIARLRGLFRERKGDREFDEEIQTHIELLTDRYIRQGMMQADAFSKARRQFGNITLHKEANREMRGLRFIETIFQDLRYGLWMLRRNPGFTFVAVLTLALGIGANTAIFSVVNALVFNPLPYRDPQQLVWVTDVLGGREDEIISSDWFLTYQAQSKTFAHLAAFEVDTIKPKGQMEKINRVRATASLFPALGVAPRLGRVFTPEEDRPGGPRVVVLSHDYWQRRFGGDPSVVGQAAPIGDQKWTMIGVMPPSYRFLPEPQTGGKIDIWVPLALDAQKPYIIENVVFGRLKPGVSIAQARSELDLLLQPYIERHPEFIGLKARVQPLAEKMVGHLRRGLLALFGVVVFVLLIACANVANLLLARAGSRRREMAIRAALGAGRKRLIRQMLTESLLLSAMGGAAGLLLAAWSVKALVAFTPENLLMLKLSAIDKTVFGFTFLATFLTGLAAGIIPAWQSSRVDLSESLKAGAHSAGLFGRNIASTALVVSELAMALVVLVGAGLLIKSFARLLAVDPGYNPKNLLTLQVGLSDKYPLVSPQRKRFNQELHARLGALPGVLGVARVMDESGITAVSAVGGPAVPDEQKPRYEGYTVSPDYFRTMQMRFRAGNSFTEQDNENKTPVIVINETLARRLFAGEDPIGRQIYNNSNRGYPFRFMTIVGVVSDVKRDGLEAKPRAAIYYSSLQTHYQGTGWVIRTAHVPLKLLPAVRQQIKELEPNYWLDAMTMEQRLANSSAPRRFQTWLFSLFAALALAIAMVGIYGVTSYAVSQRTHEIGIRMALGAQAGNVLWMVIWRGISLALAGVTLGLAAALALTRVLKNQLFEVSATDPATFALIALLLIGVALIASYIPARRATKVDPLRALRHE